MNWLVRHGESESNAGAITADYAEIPLTERGARQAAQIAAVCTEKPARVVLSPYRRARQTALPLLERFADVAVEEGAVEEFTYLAAGPCRGLNTVTRQPLVDAYWQRMAPDHCDGDGAESFRGFVLRVNRFLDRVREWPGLTIVFTHEQFIRAVIYATLLGELVPKPEVMRGFFALRSALPIPNGGIVRLERRADCWWLSGIEQRHLECAG